MDKPTATLKYNKLIYAAGMENERRKRAHAAGAKAKHQGMERVSPYYERPMLDRFFFGGYDGLTLEQTVNSANAIESAGKQDTSLKGFFAEQAGAPAR